MKYTAEAYLEKRLYTVHYCGARTEDKAATNQTLMIFFISTKQLFYDHNLKFSLAYYSAQYIMMAITHTCRKIGRY